MDPVSPTRRRDRTFEPAFKAVGGRRPQMGPQVESIKRSSPAICFGSASRFDPKNTQFITKKHSASQIPVWTPGPGQYPKGGAMGSQPQSEKRTLGPFSFSHSTRFDSADGRLPGPGQYRTRDVGHVLSTKIHAGTAPFGFSERENRVCHKGMEEGFYCREGRGPGSYRAYPGIGKQVDSKATLPGYSFGRELRATDPRKPNPEEKRAGDMPGPGDYAADRGAAINRPAYSFGRSARGEDENSLSALLREEALTRKPTELRVSDSLGKQLLSTKSTYPSWRFSIGARFPQPENATVPGPGAYVV